MPNGCLHQGRDEVVAEPEPEKCEMADDAFAAVHVAVVALVGAPVGVAAVVVVVVAAAAAVAAAVVAAAAAAAAAVAAAVVMTCWLYGGSLANESPSEPVLKVNRLGSDTKMFQCLVSSRSFAAFSPFLNLFRYSVYVPKRLARYTR